jgi:2-polyprenyl-3-methyl-5-hydroxy-6-metoxy-1,4-benzoquinol methylase
MSDFELSENLEAWQEDTYDAWVERFGTPAEVVARLRRNPTVVVRPLYRLLGEIAGARIANLMGSNGVKALALAMLGANVTVYDWSPGNARYARELAAESLLDLRYVVADVLALPTQELAAPYDVVLAELGIVHYFTDLTPLMSVVRGLLRPGGRFVLRDFHPVSTKLISSRGNTAATRKHKVTGDYFDTTLEEKEVPYAKHLDPGAAASAALRHVLWRKWTLGEIVTAVAEADLVVALLREEPNLSSDNYDRGIPKTFTLVARRPG